MNQQSRPQFFEVAQTKQARHIFNLVAISRVEILGEGPTRIVRVYSFSAPTLELVGEDAQAFVDGLEAARHAS